MPSQCLLKLRGRQPMEKRFRAVDGNDGNVVPVALQQIGIVFNIDLFKSIFAGVNGGCDHLFRIFAEVAAWPAVDHNFCLVGN